MKYALAFAASFVLVWFIVLPQVATSEGTAPPLAVSVDRFTDEYGLVQWHDQAAWECYWMVMIAGKKVAARHHSAPLDPPERIYALCMFEKNQWT
jgi:hypothetical protein